MVREVDMRGVRARMGACVAGVSKGVAVGMEGQVWRGGVDMG